MDAITFSEYIPLKAHSTFRIGGPARFFAVATTVEGVRQALDFQKERGLSLFVLGGGSNVLFSDTGFPGLVLKIALADIVFEKDQVVAGAGVSWDELVAETIRQGFSGLENLSGIPGTVGGAVVGNIGAYGVEIKDRLAWVEIFDGKEVRRLQPAEGEFRYRHSVFKTSVGKGWVVLRAAFSLSTNGLTILTYPDLQTHFTQTTPTSKALRETILEIRARKLPDIREVGTAGSFFKNPIITQQAFATLKERFTKIPSFPADVTGKVKIPAGWILDKICGLKGKRWGAVGTHEQQALVLVNFAEATAAEVWAVAQDMAAQVKAATGLDLEPEVEYLAP